MDFETALRNHATSDPIRKRQARKILAILDAPKSKRRTRQLARMERHAATALGITLPDGDNDNVSSFDWASINWDKVWNVVLEILKAIIMILPMFL